MQCPKCGSGFKHLVISVTPEYGGNALENERTEGELEVEQCFSCNGVWFDADELNTYLKEKIVLIDSPAVPQTKTYAREAGVCPKCHKPMQQVPFKNVVVDQCSTCQGVWLDGGLLDQLEKTNFSFAERWRLMFDKIAQRREKK